MAIPDRFIDELVMRTDLVDLVSEYVSLKQKGGSFWGCCPFHSEKTPSFHVLPDRQIYKCFGCGKGGGAINFVIEQENLPYIEAVRFLAKRAGMQMPQQENDFSDRRLQREKMLALNRLAAQTFHGFLYQEKGEHALDYLKNRGLSKATIKNFGLGFAPDDWGALIQVLTEQGYTKEDLLAVGLAASSQNGRIYDRFRNRVIFPIIDVQGEVIGFGGRVMGDGTPKYLNSPESIAYNKSRNLFALNRARKSKAPHVLVTEGYMDTIALHQAGFDSAIASLGTALTADHAKLLSRYFKRAVLCYDGDNAGQAATARAIPLLEQAGLQVQVLKMQGAKDPDEYIKRFGAASFDNLLHKSQRQNDYRLMQVFEKYQIDDDAQRISYLNEAATLLATIPNAIEREIYARKAAELGRISPQALMQEVDKLRKNRRRREEKQKERENLTPVKQLQPKARGLRYENIRSARAEEGVVRLLMLDETLFSHVGILSQAHFSSPLLGKLYALMLSRHQEKRPCTLSAMAGEFSQDEMDHLASVLDAPEDIANGTKIMIDYIEKIQQYGGHAKEKDDDFILEIQKNQQKKKAYLEDGQ